MKKYNFKVWHFDFVLSYPLPGRFREWEVWCWRASLACFDRLAGLNSLHWLPVLRCGFHCFSLESRESVDCSSHSFFAQGRLFLPPAGLMFSVRQTLQTLSLGQIHHWLHVDQLKRWLYIRNILKWLVKLHKLGFYLLTMVYWDVRPFLYILQLV